MKFTLKSLTVAAIALSTMGAYAAAPTYLITHNKTNVESNAFIDGIPSPYPSAPNATNKVFWNMVRMACFGHTTNGKCTALIKMETNTSTPVVLGTVSLDLDTGDISPKSISAQGYTMTVERAGEATLTKN